MHKKGTQWIVIMIDSTVIRTVHQVLQTCSDIFPIPKTLREVCTKSSGRLSYKVSRLTGQLMGQNPKELPKTHSHTHAKAIILWKTAIVNRK